MYVRHGKAARGSKYLKIREGNVIKNKCQTQFFKRKKM